MCDIGTNYIKTIKATTLFVVFLFVHSWEQRKLGDIGTTFTGLSGKSKEDFGHGNARFVTYMNVFSNPIASIEQCEKIEIDSKQSQVKYGDVFFTTSSETPEEVGMSSIWLGNQPNIYLNSFCFGYRPTIELDCYYLGFMLRSSSVRGNLILLAQGISRYNISKTKAMDIAIPVPNKDEQSKIGLFFKQFDNLITLHQRKDFGRFLQFLRQKKHSFLPISWEQRKLGDYFIERNERSGDGEMISVTINSGIRKFDELNRHDTKPDDLSKYKRVEIGDIAYNSMRMWQGASGYSPYSGILSPAYTVITPKEGVSSRFFAYLIKRPKTIHLFEINSQGLTKDTWNLKFPAFAPIEVKAPVSYEEQVNISRILIQLDNLITLHQRECFYIYKKYLLFIELQNSLQMNYSWEQCKLGDVAIEMVAGGDIDKNLILDNGRYPVIANALTNDGIVGYYNSEYRIKAPAVTVTGRGDVGHAKARLVNFTPVVRLLSIKSKHNVFFMENAINTLKIVIESTGVPQLTVPQLEKYGVVFPQQLTEEKKIGLFFNSLDNLITLHQCESCKKVVAVQSAFERKNLSKWSDSWEQRKLGELVDVCSGRDYKHLSEGTIPVYGTGGYMLSVNDALSYDRDAIGIGRKGTIDKPYILKAPFWTVDTLFYAIPREKVDLNFAFDIFQNIDWKKKDESTGVPSLSKTAINDIDVLAPKHGEQQTIGQFFAGIDHLITLHQCKVFSKNIIFKNIKIGGLGTENNTSWEQRKAKELCSIGTGKSNTQDQVDDGKYPFYIRSDIPVKSNKYLYDCEAVITIGDGNIGKVFHYVNGKFDLHQRCYKMTNFQDIWGKYFFYYFSTKFYDRAMKMTAKATVDSVRLEMISEMDIKQPSQISEQKQIAEFFDYLNNLITLHQRIKIFITGDYHDQKNK